MSPFWSIERVAEILKLSPKKKGSIHHITTDSREVGPGTLFIAIKGEMLNGHTFIHQAIERGASAILSEEEVDSALSEKAEIFRVTSTMDAIRTLARAYRQSFRIPFIAVVGAVGKTTTKELISSILAGKYKRILKTEGSQNGFLGIPLTLLRLQADTEIAVIEIGIDEIGAMEQHLALVEPTHTILTAIGPEHLHQLKTVEIAAEEELKAFDHALKHQTMIALNLSDPYVKTWSLKNRSTVVSHRVRTYSLDTMQGADFQADLLEGKIQVRGLSGIKGAFSCPLPGEHHAHNLLAAITLCSFFSMTSEEMRNGLSTFKTAYGRTEIYKLPNGVEVIGDHYNSNPTSAVAAIRMLVQGGATGKKHIAFGDMLELGNDEERFHRELARPIQEHKVDRVWLYGPRMKWLRDELTKAGFPAVAHFESHAELLHALKKDLSSKDSVLVKGSRGMKMETVLKDLLGKEGASD